VLYDPKWEVEIRSDPFSLESLIEWLEKQPSDEIYCYTEPGGCLLSQYFYAAGFGTVNMGPEDFDYGETFQHRAKLPRHFDDIAQGWSRTFGAALCRARATLSARK
jgi:hypothetical protein